MCWSIVCKRQGNTLGDFCSICGVTFVTKPKKGVRALCARRKGREKRTKAIYKGVCAAAVRQAGAGETQI